MNSCNLPKSLPPNALFSGVVPSDYELLFSCLAAHVKHYTCGEFLFHREDKLHELGLLLSGRIQIIEEDILGRRTIIGTLGQGDIFGEAFVLSRLEELSVSVLCQEDCEVLFLSVDPLLRSCHRSCPSHQQIIMNLNQSIARSNLQLLQKIQVTTRRSIREKLLCYLSQQAKSAKSLSFEIPLGRIELADYLAIDRSALSRELQKMQQEGLLHCERNHFTLIT